jgi:cyclophilin family peptidyl-prolyl cis-trans isomerase
MGTAKRERQKAGRAQRLEEARLAQERARKRNRYIMFGAIAAFVVVVFIASNVFRKDNNDAASTNTTSTLPPDTGSSLPTLPTVVPGATLTGATPCPAADGSSPRTTKFAQAPPLCIDPAKTYTAKVSTSKGDITIALDAKAAPNTVNNFVVLARYHFFDGIPFHRVVPSFVAQTGDPLGNPPGTGSPGYQFNDELPKSVDDYKPGSVAMANSGPNTNGSQWFIWVGPQPLPGPNYSLFGSVTDGEDTTVAAIMAGGVQGQDTPADPTTINYVLIGENGVYPTAPTTTTTAAGAANPAAAPTSSAPGAGAANPAGLDGGPSTTLPSSVPPTTAPSP